MACWASLNVGSAFAYGQGVVSSPLSPLARAILIPDQASPVAPFACLQAIVHSLLPAEHPQRCRRESHGSEGALPIRDRTHPVGSHEAWSSVEAHPAEGRLVPVWPFQLVLAFS